MAHTLTASTILVTGATGVIGRVLCPRLRAAGHTVFAPSRAELDLSGPTGSWTLPERCDLVIHAAASRDRAQAGPSRFPEEVRINVDATARLLDWARSVRVRGFLFVSTLSVLEPTADLAVLLDESSRCVAPRDRQPGTAPTLRHAYGLTKRWAEELVEGYSGEFEATAVVRPSMTYGEGFGVRARWSAQLSAGTPFGLAGDDGHRYAPVHVDDVVDVLVRWAAAPESLFCHVAGPEAQTERALVTRLATELSLEPTFVDDDEPAVSLASASRVADARYPGRVRTWWPGATLVEPQCDPPFRESAIGTMERLRQDDGREPRRS